MTTVSADRDLLSIGMLASHVQRPVKAIEQAAVALGEQPALKINNVAYWDAGQVQKLTAELNKGSK